MCVLSLYECQPFICQKCDDGTKISKRKKHHFNCSTDFRHFNSILKLKCRLQFPTFPYEWIWSCKLISDLIATVKVKNDNRWRIWNPNISLSKIIHSCTDILYNVSFVLSALSLSRSRRSFTAECVYVYRFMSCAFHDREIRWFFVCQQKIVK